ncbi:retron Ec78 anti-phage system effector HNH endonuclease PtuB [Ectopseudomonas alcaliphila]|uniref:retron Ec78 anti-phage system effector HNH endonuclease PtuB n=1 Tax=Ectopseudomonas alcaliphila TaxID=101564 RepID=UPI00278853A3|nr:MULTISPECIES: retron Ec78 anti-phage system effector HNH endonuclease PtuB [Pseudomonas]MDP9942641.1 uncharacterized protein (TIGR02646 family) [Pseudomonas sp. 3400]MDR7014920.1 uncharacterized protein (TIGR02646 family) [Pseudomonas alcaliphila]
MRYLHRPQPAPACLAKYNHQNHDWSSSAPNSRDRNAIWKKLTQMQGGFCCYCESIAVKGNGHIEHFFYKGENNSGNAPYKHMMFEWGNLFGSCGLRSGNTCGHYKDREGPLGPGPYDPNHLIKPDIDNPSDYFEFLPTGLINAKPGLSPERENRAKETLRVLNLSALNGARKRQIDIFKREIEALLELTSDDEILKRETDGVKKRIRESEYQTAVLSVLFG